MQITVEDLDRPFPLVWWSRRAAPGTKTICRRLLQRARAASRAMSNVYVDELLSDFAIWGKAPNGLLLTTWIAAHSSVEDHHESCLNRQIKNRVKDDNLRTALRNNEGDLRDLLSWNLMYKWFTTVFSEFAFTSVVGDENVMAVADPGMYAMGHADAALLMVQQGTHAIESCMTGMMLAATRTDEAFGPPPWAL